VLIRATASAISVWLFLPYYWFIVSLFLPALANQNDNDDDNGDDNNIIFARKY